MADKKISALPASTTPLTGTEVLPIVQGGVTKQNSVANLTAGRAISATELTLTTGNLVIGTSGKGIDFSATPGTGTSELLADYEEGTWTPGVGDLTVVGSFSSSGSYTKVGNLVTVKGIVAGSTSVAVAAGFAVCTGLPFTATTNSLGSAGNATYSVFTGVRTLGSGALYSVEAQSATASIAFSITYQV